MHAFLRTITWVLACGGLAASCSGGPPPGRDGSADLDSARDASPDEAAVCDPECPRGYSSPTYCLAGAMDSTVSCGGCRAIGKTCVYFEADLTCQSDGQWRCSYCGGSNCRVACNNPGGTFISWCM